MDEFIPNFNKEAEILRTVGNSGFLFGFDITVSGGVKKLHTEYPEAWRTHYENNNYFIKDAVFIWGLTFTGFKRWGEIPFVKKGPVSKAAQQYGLNYGGVFAAKINNKRSMLTVARHDRELTDEEMDFIDQTFRRFLAVAHSKHTLTVKELDVLKMVSAGFDYSTVSEKLNISTETVKKRLSSAKIKMGARNIMHTMAICIKRKII